MPHLLSRPAGRTAATRLGLAQITCCAVLWGTGGVVVQLLHGDAALSPVSIAFYRLGVAAAVLLVLNARGRAALVQAFRAAPVLLAVIGAGLAAYQTLYFVAVTDVGVGVATVLSIGLAPVVIASWEAIVERRLPSAATAVTITGAIVGLVLVTLSADNTDATTTRPGVGLMCAVAAGLGYAGTTMLGRRAVAAITPLHLTTITAGIGAVALLPVAAISGLGFRLAAAPVIELAYLGPVTTSLAFALFYAGLRTTTTSTAAILCLLEPLAAAVLAAALLDETLPLSTIVGGVLMVGAVAALYAMAPSRHRRRTPDGLRAGAPDTGRVAGRSRRRGAGAPG